MNPTLLFGVMFGVYFVGVLTIGRRYNYFDMNPMPGGLFWPVLAPLEFGEWVYKRCKQ